MTTVSHVATADCERCRTGVIAQPVNSVSSLAFCAAGLVIVGRHRRSRRVEVTGSAPSAETALGWSAVTAGLGSVAYHGPGTRPGRIFHDASLLTMLGALVVADTARITGRPPTRPMIAALPVTATIAAVSRWSIGIQIVAGVAATAAEVSRVRRDRAADRLSWRPIAQAVVATVGAVGHVFGRTGGPLCRPDSIFQAHAAWHTAMATVLTLRQ